MRLLRWIIPCVFLFGGCATSEPPEQALRPPNVLLLCVDDLRPELACFGKPYIASPHIDRLAARGRAFDRHYVQAPTCGASRYALLTGRYGPVHNHALRKRAERMAIDPAGTPPSMTAWFRRHGYTTVSVGKVSHHPGGRWGPDWDRDDRLEMPDSWDRHLMPVGPWRHPRRAMHGLAHGEIRGDPGAMDVFQSVPGNDAAYPDGLIVDEAINQLAELTAESDEPFFLAVGIIRPHLPFGAPAKYMEPYVDVELPPIPHADRPAGRTTWHKSGEFRRYNLWGRDPNIDSEFATQVRKHYAACVTYADAQVGRVLAELEASGAADNTVVVLWGDHGWHLGEHAVWGKHTLFEESLRSPLIVAYPGIAEPGVHSDAVVETIDLFPTLCELSGIQVPEFTQGVSLRPVLQDPAAPGRAAVAYQNARRTLRTDTHRLIVHRDGHRELYDHTSPEAETVNIAETHPVLAERLAEQLDARLAPASP